MTECLLTASQISRQGGFAHQCFRFRLFTYKQRTRRAARVSRYFNLFCTLSFRKIKRSQSTFYKSLQVTIQALLGKRHTVERAIAEVLIILPVIQVLHNYCCKAFSISRIHVRFLFYRKGTIYNVVNFFVKSYITLRACRVKIDPTTLINSLTFD